MNIKTWNFGKYKSKSYGDSRAVQIGKLTLYFSFENLIAVEYDKSWMVCKNCWSTTTGRHIANIPHDPKAEADPVEFEEYVEKILKEHGLE